MKAKNDLEKEITDWLATREKDMISLLELLVNTDSGSYDKAGVDEVATRLRGFLEGENVACEQLTIDTHGDVLRAIVPATGQSGNKPILLMGHRDTVFPKGEPERRPFRIDDGIAYGPGVADMKAGLVMNAFLLAAFTRFGGAPAPIVGLFTGDEEIGSPTSKPYIETEAKTACAVFNSEPGKPGGNVVTGRKGGVFFHCIVTGKAAHSGSAYKDGVSAIEELARKIQAFHALTDLDRGQTVNVGLICGGQSVNTVAPQAECRIDLRYVEPEDRDGIVFAIKTIAQECSLAGASASIEIIGEFCPLKQSPQSNALFDQYAACAREAGINVAGEFSGGCADSGFAAAVGAPTICSVGPIGGKAHSLDEYLELDSVVPRAQTLALTILRLSTNGTADISSAVDDN